MDAYSIEDTDIEIPILKNIERANQMIQQIKQKIANIIELCEIKRMKLFFLCFFLCFICLLVCVSFYVFFSFVTSNHKK